jgi:hypothetical protein
MKEKCGVSEEWLTQQECLLKLQIDWWMLPRVFSTNTNKILLFMRIHTRAGIQDCM